MLILSFALMALLQLEVAPAPNAPTQAVHADLVILQGVLNENGRLPNPSVMHGSPAFLQPSLDAVRSWLFGPDTPADEYVSVMFLYRDRGIFPSRPFSVVLDDSCCPTDRAAMPAKIIDPGYPVNSVAEGAVVLELRIDATGLVEDVRIVRALPSVTELAMQTVEQWEFFPALRDGQPVASSAFVVIHFWRPVIVTSGV